MLEERTDQQLKRKKVATAKPKPYVIVGSNDKHGSQFEYTMPSSISYKWGENWISDEEKIFLSFGM